MVFTKLENQKREQNLSSELDVEILRLDIKSGASFYSGFDDAGKFNKSTKKCVGVIHPTHSCRPLRMVEFAMHVRHDEGIIA